MHARSAPSNRWPLVRLATRKAGRARVLLDRRASLPAELEQLRKAAADALTTALGAEVQLDARMMDTPVVPSRALGHTAVFCLLAFGGPGAEAVLELDPRLCAALAAQRTGAARPDAPVLAATRFERALLGELLLQVLAALRGVGSPEARWRPRLLEVGASRPEAEGRLGTTRALMVELTVDSGAARGRATLHVPELALRAVALGVPEQQALPAPRWGTARLRFSPRVRCGSVWPQELAGLMPRAAVVLPGARLSDGALHGPVALVRPGVRLDGALSIEGCRYAGAELHAPSQEVTHVDPALSELPVELEVELACLSLSLAEIGGLQPGTLLPLRVSAGDPVFLRAGDRRIARAELVDIEGEVAARILERLP